MSKHTPGNWYPYFDGEHWNVFLEGGEGFGREIVGCEGLYRCDGSDEANARLIAAAPDLLESLRGYMSAVDQINAAMDDGINVQGALSAIIGWSDRANAAIAKAVGE